MTVNGSTYWVYRYEGALNDIENAVVLFCWTKDAFQEPKALHAFLCTDVSLETQTILDYYSKRWPIEIFFRQTKGLLGFDGYQVRSIRSIERFWILLAFTHLYCTIGLGQPSRVRQSNVVLGTWKKLRSNNHAGLKTYPQVNNLKIRRHTILWITLNI